MSIVSMTGFSERRGAAAQANWVWEMRGVNNKGLDLRIRLPEGFERLDSLLRNAMRGIIHRGSVNISLKITRSNSSGLPQVDAQGLLAAIAAIKRIEETAMAEGLHLGPTNAAGIMAQRGVLEANDAEEEAQWYKELEDDIPVIVAAFHDMRKAEGQAIAGVISGQIDRIATLVSAASHTLEARARKSGQTLREKIAQILDVSELPDEARLAQELAVLAVKSDVSEELDRLNVHIDAIRAMLKAGGPIGRKLDFMMQEFNREANTLCAKSASSELTAIGLDLKVTIDQTREQVQNVE